MFLSVKLSNESMQFIAEVNQKGQSRSRATAIAIARAISQNMNVPTTPVDDIKSFYNTTYRQAAQVIISKVNEVMIIDTDLTDDYVFKFVNFKYISANPIENTLALNKETAIIDFFRISTVFDKVSLDAICENPIALTTMCNKFNTIVKELTVVMQ